jgi:hypothetical protein
MKIAIALVAAATAALVAGPATADRVVVQRTVVSHHEDNRWHGGWHNRHHRVCRTQWYHHRRVTRCFYR